MVHGWLHGVSTESGAVEMRTLLGTRCGPVLVPGRSDGRLFERMVDVCCGKASEKRLRVCGSSPMAGCVEGVVEPQLRG